MRRSSIYFRHAVIYKRLFFEDVLACSCSFEHVREINPSEVDFFYSLFDLFVCVIMIMIMIIVEEEEEVIMKYKISVIPTLYCILIVLNRKKQERHQHYYTYSNCCAKISNCKSFFAEVGFDTGLCSVSS